MVAGHSGTKSLMVEFVAGYGSDLGVTHALASVFGADRESSRPQSTCAVLSLRSALMLSIPQMVPEDRVVPYPYGTENLQPHPARYFPSAF